MLGFQCRKAWQTDNECHRMIFNGLLLLGLRRLQKDNGLDRRSHLLKNYETKAN